MKKKQALNLDARLEKYPAIAERFSAMLEIVENPSDKRMTADEAEDLVSEQIQKLGSELVEDWASLEQARLAKVVGNMAGVFGHGKKNSIGKPPLAK